MDAVFIFKMIACFIWGYGCATIRPLPLGLLIAVLGSLVIGYVF